MNLWPLSADAQMALWTIVIGGMCGTCCAVLGCYLVLRRMSLLGDAISHAVLPGVALAFLASGQITGVPIFLGAMVLGVLTSLLTDLLHRRGGVPEDASMGVVFTALFALGVIVITRGAAGVDLDPGCVLYGLIEFAPLDTVTVADWELPRTAITLGLAAALTLGFVAIFWKELLLASFDPALASACGLKASVVHYALMAMVAGVTVASFEAVGSILVVSMLIVPAATAQLLTDRLLGMLAWSVAGAWSAAVLGYAGAVWLNTSVAGMIATVLGLQLLLAVLLAPRYGLLGRWRRTWQLSLRIAREDVLAALYRGEEAQARGEAAAVATLADARRLVSGPAARWALRALVGAGQVQTLPGGWLQLTAAGRPQARSIVRAHRLWERYLETHFELPLDHLHEPAERMEHFLSEALQEELAAGLEAEALDPHGRSIPPADRAG